jgi:non-ribosomal peptide synthetase component F/acyl carrier protein
VTEIARKPGPVPVPPRTPYEEAVAAIWRDVLQRSDIGVFNDFFDLGGHSLLAIQVGTRIRKTLGVDISVKDFFESPTVAALAAALAAAHGQSPARPPVTRRTQEAGSVLSYDQQRLWLENQLRPGAAYNMHGRRRLRGDIDVAALERSIGSILVRHEVLRSRFPLANGRPVQVVDEADEQWRMSFEDLSGLDGDRERERAARRLADRHAIAPFDLATGPLFRCLLIKLGATDHLLSVTMHHIVSDAWSVGLFLRELTELYLVGGDITEADLPPLPVQYRDYAVWQREWLTGQALEAELGYWRRHLDAAPPALALPVAGRRSPSQGAVGGRVRSSLSGEDTAALRELYRTHGVTLFMALLAALATVLRRWSGLEDLVIGAPIATRNDAETGLLIGFFVNTLPLRIDLSGDPSFAELLERVRTVALEGYAHGEAPFDALVKLLLPPRDPTRTPLFQVALNMVDIPEENVRIGDVSVEAEEDPVLPSKFDLLLNVLQSGDALHFELTFHGDRYDTAMMRVLLGQFGSLLRAVAADPGKPILDYPLETGTGAGQPHGPEPHPAGRRHALPTGDKVAVSGPDGEWTYQRLSGAAGRVAQLLAERGQEAGRHVGVVKRRSGGFAAAVLGCMRAGVQFSVTKDATRLPGICALLDPDPPDTPAEEVIDLRPLLRDRATAPAESPVPDPWPDDWAAGRFDLSAADRFAVLSGSSCLTVSALCTVRSAGAALLIPDDETMSDIGAMTGWLESNSVSVIYLSPALLRAMAAREPAIRLPALRYAFVANTGELTCRDADALKRISASCRCISVHGVAVTGQPLAVFAVPGSWHQDAAPLRVPLGTFTDGARASLLNPAGRPTAIGELGEICFAGQPTGDRARRLHDGTLEFAGRYADPAETTAALRDLPGVRDAVVTEYPGIDGLATLTAYIAGEDPALSVAGLRQFLITQLPEYLVPEHLVLLGRLPLTQDGDYDLAALPVPGYDLEPADTYVGPRTPIESQLTGIFEELLDVDRVGIHDTFFELNGFSLLATQLTARIHETFRCDLPLREVFQSPTVEGLAQLILRAQAELADAADLEALLAEIE